jgi:hypothetical protein
LLHTKLQGAVWSSVRSHIAYSAAFKNTSSCSVVSTTGSIGYLGAVLHVISVSVEVKTMQSVFPILTLFSRVPISGSFENGPPVIVITVPP